VWRVDCEGEHSELEVVYLYIADVNNISCIDDIIIVGPTVWNSLPRELRDPACDFDSFKQFLKTILFSLY